MIFQGRRLVKKMNRKSARLRYIERGHTCDDPSGPQEDDDSEDVYQTAGKNTVPRPE